MTAVDEYGVPLVIFGHHDADFFPLLGRLVALASLVEHNVRTLANRIIPGATELKQPSIEKVIRRVRASLRELVDSTERQVIEAYLTSASDVATRRNEYAHSLWPAMSLGRGDTVVGWRAEPWEGELPVGEGLAVMREDVQAFSSVVLTWNEEIIHVYNKISAMQGAPQ